MRNRFPQFLRAAAAVLLVSILLYIPASATQSQLDEVGEVIEELEEDRAEQEQDLENLQEDKAVLDGELAALNQELAELAAELGSLQAQLSQKEEEIQKTQEALAQAEAEEETQYENMKKRIRFFYEKGDSSLLEALLGADSFADFVNRVEYVQSIQEYDRGMLEQYRQVTAEIEVRQEQLAQEQQELAVLTKERQEQMQKVQTLLAQVESSIENASQQIADAQTELADSEARLREQQALEAELEAQRIAEEDKKRQEEQAQNQNSQQSQDSQQGQNGQDGQQGQGGQDGQQSQGGQDGQQDQDGQSGQDGQQEELPPPVISDSQSDIALLAAIIECEAGNQSYEGMLAVGSVVMNRVRSPQFPNTILEVLYQKGQFSPVASGRFAETLSRGAAKLCVQAATEVLAGNITIDKLYFRRNDGSIEDGIVIGDHVFY